MEERRAKVGDVLPRSSSSTSSSSHPTLPAHGAAARTRNTRHERMTPARHGPQLRRPSSFLLLVLVLLSTCVHLSTATSLFAFTEPMMEAREHRSVREGATAQLARLARSGTILVDQSPPPTAVEWSLGRSEHLDAHLQRRAPLGSVFTSSLPATTAQSASVVTSTSSLPVATATPTGGPLPTPFDVGFNNNITTSCQNFMTSMLSNSSFQSCLPFSLLLQNSNSFFQASKSIVRITQTLDYTCAASVTTCTTLLSSFAANITSPSTCGSDLASQNPLIQQAQSGLLAYKPLYTASCLKDPISGSYCFGEAITNATNPTDSYIYFLPLNVSLVGGSQPTCDNCLRQTMNVFEAASADRRSALASTYVSAAMQVNVNCGPNFVNGSLAPAIASGAAGAASIPMGQSALLALVLLVGSWLV